jgi:hypothetical protein
MKIIVTLCVNRVNKRVNRGTTNVRNILTTSAVFLIVPKMAYWITMLLSIEFFLQQIAKRPRARVTRSAEAFFSAVFRHIEELYKLLCFAF